MIIPPLAVLFDVLRDESQGQAGESLPLSRESAANLVLGSFFNHTTFLILGGYAISASFSRCNVESRVAAFLQTKFEHSPELFLLAMMLLGLFLSMWISNHTAPVLCVSLLSPIINDFGSDCRYVKALLLGVAFACNFGGMMTPISSLQNIIAIQQMNNDGMPMSFGAWILLSTPVAVIGTLFVWMLIIVVMRPNDVDSIPKIIHGNEPFTLQRAAVCFLSLVTILAWANSSSSKAIFGDLGIISLIFMAIIFGSGILTELDLDSFPWHTLFLLGGSNILGKVVESSELLEHVVRIMKHCLPQSPILVAAEVFFAATLVATFVSHSVAAIVLVPIIAHIGKSFHALQEFSFGGAIAISAAMAFPFSSFPNVYSLLVTDDYQNSYLCTKDFFKIGMPASVVCIIVLTLAMMIRSNGTFSGNTD